MKEGFKVKSRDFKQLSLQQLKGNYGNVTVALLVVMLITGAVSAIFNLPTTISTNLQGGTGLEDISAPLAILSSVGSVIACIVASLFAYGVSKYMLNFVRSGQSDIRYIFSGFSEGFNTWVRAFVLQVLMSVFIMLWSLLLVIPGIIASYRYMMAYYILADNEDMSAIDAIRASKQMMIGHKWELFVLHLSFIGWIALCIITCGIGFIFLAPYMDASIANFYEYLRGIYDSNKSAVA